ncbi:MAG: VWA domain-containing protein, partial [Pirellulaceae bacterium]|nr:VWA domain-containing protein [Pirellulaceae bacterium]
PEDSAKRVVVITDGVETWGSAAVTAKRMSEEGIVIDVVPIDLAAKSEILVEKIDLPTDIRQGQPFETRVVVQRYQEGDQNVPVEGRLRVIRSVGPREQILLDTEQTLDRDINVFPIRDTIDQPAGYTYRAEFVPKEPLSDALQQNNRADAFTFVRGKGRVLLIEDWNAQGEYSLLIEALRRGDIEVEVQTSDQLFTSMAELQAYDCVILAGVPRSSGESADNIANFSDEQIEMLVRNTETFGSGLIMLGGPNAFGAGGWANTQLEKAMPVDFQIKNTKVDAVGALAMILHASEIAQGNYWQKRISRAAMEVLGPMDFVGVMQYGALGDQWLWGDTNGMIRVGPNRQAIIGRLNRMTPGDMPDFEPAMRRVLNSLVATPASVKHTIIISDGDPTDPSNGVLTAFKNAQIKISTVAVGSHGPAMSARLQKIATVTGGNYYVASNANALPRIFMREAMRVSRPLVYEPDGGVQPQITYPHEIVQGLSRDLPNLTGYVLTTVKSSPLVQVSIQANKPSEPENQTILASWQYGAGKSAVFTSDVGKRWASSWAEWSGYDQFFTQLVRVVMRPSKNEAKFSIAANYSDGKIEVVVNALNQQDEFLNFLDMSAVTVGPDLKPLPIVMRQAAPGRYVGSFQTDTAGSYLLNVNPGPGMAPLTTGVSVPFSDEYRIRQTNMNVLNQIAALEPTGGRAGTVTSPLDPKSMPEVLGLNTYRPGLPQARSLQDIWPWCVVLGAICLFSDIFIRRVSLDYSYPIKRLIALTKPKLKAEDVARQASLQRLRGRKSAVNEELDQQRAATRFESEGPVDLDTLQDAQASSTGAAAPVHKAQSMTEEPKEAGYTSRLLAAKKEAQRKTGQKE